MWLAGRCCVLFSPVGGEYHDCNYVHEWSLQNMFDFWQALWYSVSGMSWHDFTHTSFFHLPKIYSKDFKSHCKLPPFPFLHFIISFPSSSIYLSQFLPIQGMRCHDFSPSPEGAESTLQAGGSFEATWTMEAGHPGDCYFYLSPLVIK